MKIKLFLLASLFFAGFFSSAQNSFIKDSLDIYVNREMLRWKMPGVAVAIVKDGKVVLVKGYGVREIGKPGTVDENTLFQIASNTKAFTATCVSMLNIQKRLSLDDKIQKWIKDFQLYDTLASRDVTIRDMLCHRIGFKTFQSDFLNWNCNLTRQELIHNMRNVKPEYSFRSRYGYCNMGFVTAGEVIKMVTDTTWEDFVKVHLLDPLKMNHTSTSWSYLTNDANSAVAHTVVNDTILKIPYANVENIGPCASFNSCVKDLANWLLMQLDSGRFDGKRIVPYAALRETWRSQMLVSDQGDPLFPMKHFSTYGLGWFLNDYAGRKVISHSGGANGFVTKTMFVPEEQLGIVVLTNTDANSFYEALGDQVLESYLHLPYRNLSAKFFDEYKDLIIGQEAELKTWNERMARYHPVPSLPVRSYEGRYHNEVYGDIDIKNESGKLNIYFSHHPQIVGHLECFEANEFVCTYSDLTCGVKKIPFTVVNDKVKSVTIRVNDFIDYLPYEFQKVN